MTKTLKVNGNNDIYAVAGLIQIESGANAVAEACAQSAKVLKGEMIYAINEGVDYFNIVWNGSPNVVKLEANLRSQFMRIDGVLGIDKFSAKVEGNSMMYNVTIRTVYGSVDVSENIQV